MATAALARSSTLAAPRRFGVSGSAARRGRTPLAPCRRDSYPRPLSCGSSKPFGVSRGRRDSRSPVAPRAAPGNYEFELSNYVEAKIERVTYTEHEGNYLLVLKIMLPKPKWLVLYIGHPEYQSLVKQLERRHMHRPMTHDLMKSSIEALGFRVTKACIDALIGNTYHGSVHYKKNGGSFAEEIVEDARPSDAINLAIRFGAMLYVHKDVVAKNAYAEDSVVSRPAETKSDIINSVKKSIMQFNDPTYMHKLQLELAVKEERYDDAVDIRDTIDNIMTSNRELGLIVAMETALNDNRLEEAAALRDEYRRLVAAKEFQSKEEVKANEIQSDGH